jgi:ribosomal protein S18 acetylase RimI-like enzyme
MTHRPVSIRPCAEADKPGLVDLTIETFRPFYEGYVHPLMGDELFRLHHGQWEQDYRDQVPALHDPAHDRYVAVADLDGVLAGYVSWATGPRPDHGEITLLAVASAYRGQQVGRRLCEHGIAAMTTTGVAVVGIGTGDDAFHTAARGLYESLGFTKIPIAGYIKRI